MQARARGLHGRGHRDGDQIGTVRQRQGSEHGAQAPLGPVALDCGPDRPTRHDGPPGRTLVIATASVNAHRGGTHRTTRRQRGADVLAVTKPLISHRSHSVCPSPGPGNADIRRRRASGPCHDVPSRWHVPRGCAYASESRACAYGGGCSVGMGASWDLGTFPCGIRTSVKPIGVRTSVDEMHRATARKREPPAKGHGNCARLYGPRARASNPAQSGRPPVEISLRPATGRS